MAKNNLRCNNRTYSFYGYSRKNSFLIKLFVVITIKSEIKLR